MKQALAGADQEPNEESNPMIANLVNFENTVEASEAFAFCLSAA